MILYKAIKYTILDYCIEKLFDSLKRNLNTGDLKEITIIDEVYEGMILNRVEHGDYRCLDCKVTHIDKGKRDHITMSIEYQKTFCISTGKYDNVSRRGIFLFTNPDIPGWGTETYLYK